MIRWSLFLAMAAGLAAFVAVLLVNGLGQILHSVAAIGWGLAFIVAVRIAAVSLAGIAWGAVLGETVHRSPGLFIGLRFVREAINSLLPAAQVGGDLIGARLISRCGVPAGLAAASILIDILLQTTTQGLFAVTGLAALWFAAGDTPLVRQIGGSLILLVPALGGFLLAQRLGLFALVDRGAGWLSRFLPGLARLPPLELQPALKRLYSDRSALLWSAAIHLAGWAAGVAEVWVALGRMGARPTALEALALESLGQAVRSTAFAVPGAYGVQEAGFMLLGALFGLPAQTALALSLAKRLADFAIGVPGLCAWQVLEALNLRLPRTAERSGG